MEVYKFKVRKDKPEEQLKKQAMSVAKYIIERNQLKVNRVHFEDVMLNNEEGERVERELVIIMKYED